MNFDLGSFMITMVCCYDPIKMQNVLGYSVEPDSDTPPLLSLVFQTGQHACVFYLTHFWALKELRVDLDLQFNLIHVRISDESMLCTVISYFYMYYRPLTNQYEILNGILYSSIQWTNIPVRI